MILDIIAYLSIAATVVWVLWRIFFKKDKSCSCSSGCDGCPYCSSCNEKARSVCGEKVCEAEHRLNKKSEAEQSFLAAAEGKN